MKWYERPPTPLSRAMGQVLLAVVAAGFVALMVVLLIVAGKVGGLE